MNVKYAIYNFLVNRIPGIKVRYRKVKDRMKGFGKIGAWFYLIGLNICYYIFQNKNLRYTKKFPIYEEKKLYNKGSESSISKREAPVVLAEKLAQYDVVSFDVFDTLILRPFSEPTDLFFLLGKKLKYLDFEQIRKEMEWKAREKKYKKKKHYEVTLEEIYDLLCEETGIPKTTMELEVELENEFCFANPYMFEVVKELKKRNQRMIIISDMYLNTEQIKELLDVCGYPEFDAYYVSCDLEKSKSMGTIFDEIKKQEGREHTYVHVGDNVVADVKQAEKHGFKAEYYVNVNTVGMSYRPEDMSAIIGSAYRGIVNAYIHNGLTEYTRGYEFGYIYGGLFVVGYCGFIHDYVKKHEIEKILFLSRDGNILKQVYEKLYPEETEKCEYVYWSRLAATKMAAGYFKYDYFRRFLYHKKNQGYTIEEIFCSMELSDMMEEFCSKSGEKRHSELTECIADQIKEYLMRCWDEVLERYEEQLAAGKQYYEEVLAGCTNATAVDIGWAGSGAITLDYIVNYIWNLNCPITGIVAGANSCHSVDGNASEPLFQSGSVVSYLYSQRENRDLWKLHDPDNNYNLYWEMLLDAPHGSLRGFYLNEQGEYECRFKEYEEKEQIREIQQGILKFAEDYKKHFGREGMYEHISGRDAYAPMILALSQRNRAFMKPLNENLDDANLT